MSSTWFASKIAPNGDTTHNEGGCHPQEAQALETYLHHNSTPPEAAHAITRPVSNAADPKAELHHLWGLIQDAFIELPQTNIPPLIALMQAIENLPNPASNPNESRHPDNAFWRESPGFGNLWADMHPRSCFRAIVDGSAGMRRELMKMEHVRRAHVEAQLVCAGLVGLTIHWGYEVVADALESSDAVFEFEVPAAGEWLVVCGERFVRGAVGREGSWGLERRGGVVRDLWEGDGAVMTMERLRFWKERLRGFQGDGGLVGDVRRAFEAVEEAESQRG